MCNQNPSPTRCLVCDQPIEGKGDFCHDCKVVLIDLGLIEPDATTVNTIQTTSFDASLHGRHSELVQAAKARRHHRRRRLRALANCPCDEAFVRRHKYAATGLVMFNGASVRMKDLPTSHVPSRWTTLFNTLEELRAQGINISFEDARKILKAKQADEEISIEEIAGMSTITQRHPAPGFHLAIIGD